MQFDRHKLRAVVLHTVAKCDPSKLGAVKLHKVLYFSDMLCYADTGNAITGSLYKKRPYGPTCEQLQPVLSDLVRDGVITVRTAEYFGYQKKEYYLKGETEDYYLSANEIAALDEVITFVCDEHSARSISEFSHGKPWESVAFGDEIRYSSVYHMFPSEVSPEALDWASSQVSDVANTKSCADPMDFVDIAAFRSKVLAAE